MFSCVTLLPGMIGPCRRLNNTAHNEPHVFAIYVLDLSSSDQSIKLLSFYSGDGFVFLNFPLARIVDQPAYPASIESQRAGRVVATTLCATV